ncbi:MAG: hypothetical protein ABIK28_16565 [Planctomycetota bacterium]
MIRLCVVLSFLWACSLFLVHALSYFYLKDDFAILDVAQNQALCTLFTHGFFGFYRPVAFALMKAQFTLLGWENAHGHMLISLAFHGLNAFFLGLLARNVLNRTGAALAASLFFLSPWAGESVFWLSGVFDRLAATGMLLTLLFSIKALERSGPLSPVLIVLSLCSCLIALFSKEVAVTLPALFILLVTIRRSQGFPVLFRRTAILFLLLASAVFFYMAVRSNVLGAFHGAYGDFFDLARKVRPHRLVHAFFLPPVSWAEGVFSQAGCVLFAVVAALALCAAVYRKPWSAWLLGVALFISLCPVMFFKMHVMNTEGGRFLYVPGIFMSILFAMGLARLIEGLGSKPWRRVALNRVAAVLVVLFFCHALQSLDYQKRLWKCASTVSRSCIEQFAGKIQDHRPCFIENLPSQLLQGPYILNAYSFPYYFHGQEIRVRANPIILSFDNGCLEEVEDELDQGRHGVPQEEEIRIVFIY